MQLLLLLAGAYGLDNGLGHTPPLGWSGFNFFAFELNESVMLETADAMVSTGLARLGFEVSRNNVIHTDIYPCI